MKKSLLSLYLILCWHVTRLPVTGLVFPASSAFQVTILVSAPVENPIRKIFWNWGIQSNYDLPFSPQNFINVPLWPNKWEVDDRRKRRELLSDHDFQGNQTWGKIAERYGGNDMEKHPSDFTAGELYYSLENLLTSYGFHETCLLRSVCELARHPFDDAHTNLLTEILKFILSPSLHEAFSDTETLYRDVYEAAERNGFLQYDCAELYSECQEDLLTTLTNVIEINM
ncbi:uncharacterized protein [Musca autumnalis]|uniref:uncharacterized protein n=1 Tax=Musca autumnalis TaxID=221902 RepID=UPI003CF8157D